MTERRDSIPPIRELALPNGISHEKASAARKEARPIFFALPFMSRVGVRLFQDEVVNGHAIEFTPSRELTEEEYGKIPAHFVFEGALIPVVVANPVIIDALTQTGNNLLPKTE